MRWYQRFLRRALTEKRLDAELRFHLDQKIADLVAVGIAPEEARRRAQLEFGGLDQVKEECRDVGGSHIIESLIQDARYGLRQLRRNPLFACGIAATIGLGIGMICSLFAVFNAYVLRPVAVRDPYRLYEFQWNTEAAGHQGFSWPELEHLRADTSVFSEVIASSETFAFLEGRPSPGRLVTGNYFSTLGVEPAIGRTLQPDDAAVRGAQPVVVLSYSAWKNGFGGDPHILARKITLRGYPFQVVGVMRPEFEGIEDSKFKRHGPDFWVPITMSRQFSPVDLFGTAGRDALRVVGRLRSEITEKKARAALESYVRSVTSELPDDQRPFRFSLDSRATPIPLTPDLLAEFTVILGIFGLVLLIACANVANMMLARAMARQREIGVRLSLGAGRPRLIRQLLTEALLLSLPGAAVGFAIAFAAARFGPQWFLSALHAPALAAMIRLPSFDPDLRVFAFACAAATLSAILFGLAPALQATHASLTSVARGGFGSDPRPARLRNALVILQVTVCVLFLVTAGMLLRGSRQLAQRDTGMDLSKVAFATGAAAGIHAPLAERDLSQIAERLSAEPWVEQIATAVRPPLWLGVPHAAVMPASSRNQLSAEYNHVSPEYFRVLGIPLKRGRTFTEQERGTGAAVVIISESAALRLWPKEDAIGQSLIIIERNNAPERSAQVIGVAGDATSGWIYDRMDANCLYFPIGPQTAAPAFLIRIRSSVETARRAFAATVESVAPRSEWRFVPMEEMVNTTLLPFRTISLVAWILAGVALLLTVSGIYGVMSYLVSQRTQEIGIRMALGADRAAVTRIILGQSLKLVTIGAAIGVILALALSKLVAASWDIVDTFDRLAYLGGVGTVVLAALAAAYFPSRRATRVDPMVALRYE